MIIILAFVLISPYHLWLEGNFTYFVITRTWQFLIQAAVPCTLLLFLNVALYKILMALMQEEELQVYANVALLKSIRRIRLALYITSIFVISETLFWMSLPYEVSIEPIISIGT